jgi:dienelactone hydrolase
MVRVLLAFLGVWALSAAVASAEDVTVKTQTIDYAVGDTAMQGYLAIPADTGKRAGVLIVPEWWGVNDYAKSRARQLAGLGYTALVVDMYGKGKVTSDPKQAGDWAGEVKGNADLLRKRFTAGIDILNGQESVLPGNLAAIGYCFGGSVVLEAARAGLPLKGVVSFHGDLQTRSPAKAETLKAKVLVLHGAADPMVPPAQVEAIEQEMKSAGADFKLVAYPDAVHSFTNPDAGKADIPGVAYDAEADRKSWDEMKAFFGRIFATPD